MRHSTKVQHFGIFSRDLWLLETQQYIRSVRQTLCFHYGFKGCPPNSKGFSKTFVSFEFFDTQRIHLSRCWQAYFHAIFCQRKEEGFYHFCLKLHFEPLEKEKLSYFSFTSPSQRKLFSELQKWKRAQLFSRFLRSHCVLINRLVSRVNCSLGADGTL